jgi:tetratricopeptide (TPR) repeat protein
MSIQNTLNKFIDNPYNDKVVFDLANLYYNQNQTASALTYYLRITELDSDLVYPSLLRAGLCLERQTNRVFSVKGLYLHAISHSPNRPEAYFLLSRLYERNREWQESYTIAAIAEHNDYSNNTSLLIDVEYPGIWGFKFEKAVSSWWMGRIDESLELFLSLDKHEIMDAPHITSVKNNIKMLTNSWHIPVFYTKNKMTELRYKFKNHETIQSNHSQCFQDMFILSALDGKQNGKYLEIGSADPYFYSNTALLEEQFGWDGISLDIDENEVNKFKRARKNTCLHADALKTDYKKLLDDADLGTDWDYLQLDCEPPNNTFEVLLSIPFEKYRFAVITYEHDYYCDETKSYRDKSRRYLESKGYELAVDNISADDNSPFEDWWIHPDLVDKNVLSIIRSVTNNTKKAENYIYNK